MYRLGNIWKNNTISRALKVRLCRAIVLPTVMYGSGSWITKVRERIKLLTLESYCLRKMARNENK